MYPASVGGHVLVECEWAPRVEPCGFGTQARPTTAVKPSFPVSDNKHQARWPSGLRRHVKEPSLIQLSEFRGPKGREFESHPCQLYFCPWGQGVWLSCIAIIDFLVCNSILLCASSNCNESMGELLRLRVVHAKSRQLIGLAQKSTMKRGDEKGEGAST